MGSRYGLGSWRGWFPRSWWGAMSVLIVAVVWCVLSMILDMFIFQDAPARRAENGLHGLLNVGFLAVVIFRLSQIAGKRLPLLGSLVKQVNHVVTGADLAWEVSVGPGFMLYHPTGVVMGRRVKAGANVKVQSSVTISEAPRGQETILGNNVRLGAGCRIIKPLSLADDVSVGANAVVTKSCERPGAVLVGIPARELPAK